MKSLFKLALLSLSTVGTLMAQTPAQAWFKVAAEGDSVTATATVRYGAAQGATAVSGKPCALATGCWKQLAASGTFTVGNAMFGDPISGTVKELDVLETASPQTVVVNGKTVTVPALPQPGTPYTLTCSVVVPSGALPSSLPLQNCTLVKQPSSPLALDNGTLAIPIGSSWIAGVSRIPCPKDSTAAACYAD